MAEENKPQQSRRVYATGAQLERLRGTSGSSRSGREYAPEGMNALLSETALSDESWYDDPTMASMMFLDGVTFGFSDELAAGFSAAIQTISDPSQDYRTAYKNTVIGMEEERNAYQEKFPEASLALNVAGGLATAPFSLTGNLARGGMALGAAATRAAPTATRAISQVASGVPASVSNVLARGTTAAAATAPFAEMAAIGGLSGVGFAQQGADLGQSAIDGMVSAVQTGTALKFIGKTAQVASNQRVQRNLRTQEGFRGLSLSEDGGTLENIYKGVVKDLPFAKGLIDQQNKKYAAPLEARVKEGQARVALIRDSAGLSKYLNKEDDFASALLKKNEAQELKGISEALGNQEAKIIDRHQTKLTAEIQKINDRAIEAGKEFRRKAFSSSLPASLNKKEQASILSQKNANDAFRKLSNGWTDRGFEVIKKKDFKINTDAFVQRMQDRVAKEIDDAEILYGLSRKDIDTKIGSFLEKNVRPDGRISGDDVAKLRNKLSAQASSFGNPKELGVSLVNRKILDEVNDSLLSQLKPADRIKFNTDVQNYKHFISLTDAVAAASTKGARGAFNSEQWLAALKKNNGTRQFAAGKGVLFREANELSEYTAKASNETKKAAEVSAKLQKAKISAAKSVLQNEARQVAKRTTDAQLKNMGESVQQLNTAQAKLTEDMNNLQKLKEIMPSISPDQARAPFLYGGGILGLGAFSGGGLGAIFSAISIPSIGGFLGSETGQLILAGQTKAQQAASRGLERAKPVTGAVSRAAQLESVRGESSSPTQQEFMTIARVGSPSAKAALYRQLAAKNELDEYKKINGEYFNAIKNAWEAQQSN
jgi:hypothetical protein